MDHHYMAMHNMEAEDMGHPDMDNHRNMEAKDMGNYDMDNGDTTALAQNDQPTPDPRVRKRLRLASPDNQAITNVFVSIHAAVFVPCQTDNPVPNLASRMASLSGTSPRWLLLRHRWQPLDFRWFHGKPCYQVSC